MTYTPAATFNQAQHLGPSREVSALTTTTTTTAEDQGRQDAAFHQAFSEAEASLQDVHLSSHLSTEDLERTEAEMTGLDERQESMAELGDRLEADALADTAGELLYNMRAEQSAKFRESSFMALMGKLRDREVVVEEGKMVEAATHREIKSHQPGDLGPDPAGQGEGDESAFDRPRQNYHGTDFGDRP